MRLICTCFISCNLRTRFKLWTDQYDFSDEQMLTALFNALTHFHTSRPSKQHRSMLISTNYRDGWSFVSIFQFYICVPLNIFKVHVFKNLPPLKSVLCPTELSIQCASDLTQEGLTHFIMATNGDNISCSKSKYKSLQGNPRPPISCTG